ncbi:MAG: peptidoglycan-binding protein [Candidatus Campbellbacteria bacterium]|nr:peptidoglycan-binding protein [Candidatus Campbellbacteria bacterium]
MSTHKKAFWGTPSSARLVLGASFFIGVFFLLLSARASAETFSRNLRLGDSGGDVWQLQILLNQNTVTHVAEAGDGSPGYETSYYGVLTADAVRRYQELYREEILIPAGLVSGTGFFGPSTRAFISDTPTIVIEDMGTGSTIPAEVGPDAKTKELFTSIVSRMNLVVISDTEMLMARKDTEIVPETIASPPTTRAVMDLVQNQNENNVEILIAFLDEGGYLNDMDSKTKDAVKNQIRKDSKKDIIELIQSSDDITWAIPQAQKTGNLLFRFLTSVVTILKPKEALAVSLLPFGGTIYYRFFCYYSDTWAIVIAPPGMLTPAWVGYTYAQGYANWNMPFASKTIGLYVPGTQTCYITYEGEPLLIPTMGVISFITGSDL